MRTGRYSRAEVEALVEGWEELHQQRDVSRRRLPIVHGLLDLGRAMPALTGKQREAVVLMGHLGFNYRQAASILKIDPTSMYERYEHALTRLTEIMNRGGR